MNPLFADSDSFGVIAAVIAVADIAVLIPASRRGFDIARAIDITRLLDVARAAAIGDCAANEPADNPCGNAAGDDSTGVIVMTVVTRGSRLNGQSNKGRGDQQAANNSLHNILLSGTCPG
jgi:hypothetical protein